MILFPHVGPWPAVGRKPLNKVTLHNGQTESNKAHWFGLAFPAADILHSTCNLDETFEVIYRTHHKMEGVRE